MKKLRCDRAAWKPPEPILEIAIFKCKRCQTDLTKRLTLVRDVSHLDRRANKPLLPLAFYWIVSEGQAFAETFALNLGDLLNTLYHPDSERTVGCCGPSGAHGRNRICQCGNEVGTEQSDCIFPHAMYLDPLQVYAASPE